MSAGDVTPVTGPRKVQIIDRAMKTNEFRLFREEFARSRDYAFLQTRVIQVISEASEVLYVVSFVLDDFNPDTLVDVTLVLRNGTVEYARAGIDQYVAGQLDVVERFQIRNQNVVGQRFRLPTASTSAGGSTACNFCKQSWQKLNSIVQNSIVGGIAKVTTNVLCAVMAASLTGGIPTFTGAYTACSQIAGKIINYAQSNGLGASATTACRAVNICP